MLVEGWAKSTFGVQPLPVLPVAIFGQSFFGDGSHFGQEQATRRNPTRTRMASNSLPSKREKLFALGDDMVSGLNDHEVSLGIKQNTETVIDGALTAARAAESAFGVAQLAKKNANTTLTNADRAARVFIGLARKRLSKFFGESASMEWQAAGWPPGDTAVPTTQDERFEMMAKLRAHFANNAAHESTDMEVTAALALAGHTAIKNARGVLAQKTAESGIAKGTRDTAEANLRDRMEGLIGELDTLLSDEDPRWHAFGLNRPADEETPEAPSFTTVLAGPNNSLLVDWDDSLRADRWRVWIKVVGVDTDFRNVVTVTDSDATVPGLTPGATVQVQVTAANDAGESGPGPMVQVVVA